VINYAYFAQLRRSLETAVYIPRNYKFESIPLQQRVRKPSVPRRFHGLCSGSGVEFLWYRDNQHDIEPRRFGSAAIGCLHDAGTATGTDDKAPLLAIELLRPGR